MPQSLAAERALLGALLLDADEGWAEDVHNTVRAYDFFFPPHRAIYGCMRALAVKGWEVNVITVTHELSEQGLLDEVDHQLEPDHTEPYLASLWGETFAATGCIAFARMVREYADEREGARFERRAIAL